MIISRESAKKILKPIQDVLLQIPTLSWDDYQNDKLYSPEVRLRHAQRTRANIIWSHMVFHAKRLLADIPGIHFEDKEDMFLVYYKETVSLRFKKFDEDNHSSNVQTERTKTLLGQGELGGMPKMTWLIVGYQLNPMQSCISSILITCPTSRSRNAWKWELSDEGTNEQVVIPIRPKAPTAQPAARRVVVKAKEIDIKVEKHNE